MTLTRPLARAAVLAGIAALASVALIACNRRGSTLDPHAESATATATTDETDTSPSKRPPTGTSCAGRDDCPSDQVCVDRSCRYRTTSIAGEILATSASAQVEAGDWEGAIRTYDQAIEAFDTAHAPVPPELLCESAAIILRTSTDPEGRERGAQRADRCFRSSLPGFPPREEVRRAVARLRFEGLDVALFDRADPAERFFTAEPSRPTIDALAIDLQLPESEESGVEPLRAQLAGDAARRAIAECFLQDWELRHERSASASLVVRFSTRLHDMGTYDVYEPELLIERTTAAEDGFEPCVAAALPGAITFPRGARVVAWQTSLDIAVRVQ